MSNCTRVQLEVVPRTTQTGRQTIQSSGSNPLASSTRATGVASSPIQKKSPRIFHDPISLLPTHLQRYIFEFLADEIQDAKGQLFNFALAFSRGPNIVFEFHDLNYIKTHFPYPIREFQYFNAKLLTEQQRFLLTQKGDSPPEPEQQNITLHYSVLETAMMAKSFFKDIYSFIQDLFKLCESVNFPEKFLFRSDSRDPHEIFASGFQRNLGNRYRPNIYITSNSLRTAVHEPMGDLIGTFVSTTSDPRFAENFNGPYGWIYVCIPKLGLDLSHIDAQKEYSLTYVAPDEIMLGYNKMNREIFWNSKFIYFLKNTFVLMRKTATGNKIITGNKLLADYFISLYTPSRLI